ncbi:MAG: sigma-70 family RNA polymerase sigma factor [Sedimenticola sp.]
MTDNATYIDLLARSALRDQNAFSRLYELSSPKLFGLLLRILKRDDLAQECLQQAYVKIWNSAGDYREGLAAPMTWMSTIARYTAYDLLRKSRRESYLDDIDDAPELVDEGADVFSAVHSGQVSGSLMDCIKQLNENQMQSVLLGYYEGLTYPEIAGRMGAPVGTVKTWMHRGLASLRECMH